MGLTNKHVAVVGSSRRIGLYLTEKLLESGCKVSGLYRTPSPELTSLKSLFPDRLHLDCFDLRDVRTAGPLAAKIHQQNGRIFGVIHVASQFFKTPLGQVTSNAWDELFDTNVKGHFFLTQALAPYLEAPSHLINLVDIFSTKPLRNYLAYTAAKGALMTLTRNLANELAPNTRVNAISPGPVLLPEGFSEEEKLQYSKNTLLGRTGDPSDIWSAVHFLLNSNYITGINLCVDGGSFLM